MARRKTEQSISQVCNNEDQSWTGNEKEQMTKAVFPSQATVAQ